MTLEELRELCSRHPGTVEDVKWEADRCFSVGGKMYAITGMQGPSAGLTLKTTREGFVDLVALDGVVPAPYLARYHWVRVGPTAELDDALPELIAHSYELVKAKLSKKVQRSLGSS